MLMLRVNTVEEEEVAEDGVVGVAEAAGVVEVAGWEE